MLDFFKQATVNDETVDPLHLLLRLAGAWLAGMTIVLIYRFTRRNAISTPTFAPTLVLLAILVAMVTQVIGNNAARAFSLVGALSIVRFRTVVEDTHDIAFVIFSVVVGMAIGANHWMVALFGMAIVGSAAACLRPSPVNTQWHTKDSTLQVRVGIGRDPESLLAPVFSNWIETQTLIAGTSSRQGTAFDLTYKVRFRKNASPATFLDELNRLDGVQSVELKRES